MSLSRSRLKRSDSTESQPVVYTHGVTCPTSAHSQGPAIASELFTRYYMEGSVRVSKPAVASSPVRYRI